MSIRFLTPGVKKHLGLWDGAGVRGGLEEGYLQVREHAQKAPEQAAVDGFSAALPLYEQQDAVDGLALDLQVADDVEPKELQAHVPETHTHTHDQGQRLTPENERRALVWTERNEWRLTRLKEALSFVRRRCGPGTRIYSWSWSVEIENILNTSFRFYIWL